jgi:hypothetical protein
MAGFLFSKRLDAISEWLRSHTLHQPVVAIARCRNSIALPVATFCRGDVGRAHRRGRTCIRNQFLRATLLVRPDHHRARLNLVSGQVDGPPDGDVVEQQEVAGTDEAPTEGAPTVPTADGDDHQDGETDEATIEGAPTAPTADGDDHQDGEGASAHVEGEADAPYEGGLEREAADEVPTGASPTLELDGAGMDGGGENELSEQHDVPAAELRKPEEAAPAILPSEPIPAAAEVASPPIPTGPMPADDAAMNEGLTNENSAIVEFFVASENFSHRKQIHLDAIFEDIKKALEIELGISATAQQLSLNDRTHHSTHVRAR